MSSRPFPKPEPAAAPGETAAGDSQLRLRNDRTGLAMACPRCPQVLKGQRHATGIAWRCLGCGGQSLNFSQFRRMVPAAQADGIWDTALRYPLAPRRRARCPECQRDMAAVHLPLEERELELSICRTCQRLWLDRQESIAAHLNEDQAAGPQPPAWKVTHRARDRMAGEMARSVRRRFSLSMDQIAWGVFCVILLYWVARMLIAIHHNR